MLSFCTHKISTEYSVIIKIEIQAFIFYLQKEVESAYQELTNLAEERGYRLQESKRFFNFMRDADEVAAWIHDQMVIASSEDYGKDVEHVEVSLQLLFL